MTTIKQLWFDMEDLRRPRIPTASWLPLRANQVKLSGEFWKPGCIEEYCGVVSIVLPQDQREAALKLAWVDVDSHQH